MLISAEQARLKIAELDKNSYEKCLEEVSEKINKAIEQRKYSVDIYTYVTPEVINHLSKNGYKVMTGIPSDPNEVRTKITWKE